MFHPHYNTLTYTDIISDNKSSCWKKIIYLRFFHCQGLIPDKTLNQNINKNNKNNNNNNNNNKPDGRRGRRSRLAPRMPRSSTCTKSVRAWITCFFCTQQNNTIKRQPLQKTLSQLWETGILLVSNIATFGLPWSNSHYWVINGTPCSNMTIVIYGNPTVPLSLP